MADVSENYYDSDRDGSLNGSPLCVETTCYSDMDIVASPFAYPGPENLLVAPEAVEHVLEGAGTSYPRRDAIDARVPRRRWSRGGAAQARPAAHAVVRRRHGEAHRGRGQVCVQLVRHAGEPAV